ncbi:MAG: hypothetical protein ACI9YL_000058 [Luteibaculaceae bacterium]|jgi:hypothetical protein
MPGTATGLPFDSTAFRSGRRPLALLRFARGGAFPSGRRVYSSATLHSAHHGALRHLVAMEYLGAKGLNINRCLEQLRAFPSAPLRCAQGGASIVRLHCIPLTTARSGTLWQRNTWVENNKIASDA